MPVIEYHYTWVHPIGKGAAHHGYETRSTDYSFEGLVEELAMQEWQVTPTGLRWPSYAWPGAYEIHYITKDCGVLCHDCANKELSRTLDEGDEQFFIVNQDINYESDDLFCDHCSRQIKPAYGD